jgi:putative flippase GtrA
MTPFTLGARYALFAAVATAVNLVTQILSLSVYDAPPLALPLAMSAGTVTGLVVKYILDKRWIFSDFTTGLDTHARKFSLYTLMGVFTTAIFWGTELTFDAVFEDPHMRYVGGAIGLAIGYLLKFRLDQRFVFERAAT